MIMNLRYEDDDGIPTIYTFENKRIGCDKVIEGVINEPLYQSVNCCDQLKNSDYGLELIQITFCGSSLE